MTRHRIYLVHSEGPAETPRGDLRLETLIHYLQAINGSPLEFGPEKPSLLAQFRNKFRPVIPDGKPG